MKKVSFTLFIVLLFSFSVYGQTKVIAHRGFWKAEGSAQNSIVALEKAAEAQVYGAEFDVWITSDGVAVINHDKDINGVVIENTPYDRVKQERLSNGEKISNLKKYLRMGAKHKGMKLILELKDHASDENDVRAVETVIKIVRASKAYKNGQLEFISFNYQMCKRFAEAFPDIPVAYLKGDMSPEKLKKAGIDGLDYHKGVIKLKKGWIKEAHDLGMTVNVWTVNSESSIIKMKELGVDFITTDNPLEAKELLKQK